MIDDVGVFSLSSLNVILKGFFKRSAVWGVPAAVPKRFLTSTGVLDGSSGGVTVILGKKHGDTELLLKHKHPPIVVS